MACLINTIYNALFGPRFYSIEKVKEMASPGDLIAFNRGTYQHYALYTGNGRVINIGAEDIFETRALISELLIEDVAGDSRARIENQGEYAAFHFRKRAAYPREILRRAKMHVGAYLPYEFMFRNCEYYCTLWRFGVGFSAQVIHAKPVTGHERYDKLARHRASCKCLHGEICHCTLEFLDGELQVLDLLIP